MTDHDQLAAVIRAEYDKLPVSRYPNEHALADAILAVGWQPPSRRLGSAEELDVLPDRTIIVDRYGTAAQKTDDDLWEFPNEIGRLLGEGVDLPAIVLWSPPETKGEQ